MEAFEGKYFVDGFLLKNYGIWPRGMDKDNLYEEQKVFLCFLSGVIPNTADWRLNMDYKRQFEEIIRLSEKDVAISQEKLDLALLQGKSIDRIKKDALREEKERRLFDLNKKFHIEPDLSVEVPKPKENSDDPKRLWDILSGQGIIGGSNEAVQEKGSV